MKVNELLENNDIGGVHKIGGSIDKLNFLRVLFLAILLTVFMLVNTQNSAFATRSLKVVNHSGEKVVALYGVEISYPGWGDDILGNDTLDNNWYQYINFSDNVRYVKVKAYFTGGRYKYWEKIDLFSVKEINVTRYGS